MPGRVYVSGTPTREGFTGHELDAETGMNYAGARYYMPALGRWTSVDPLASSFASYSPYNYALNNPLSLTDPTGMAPQDYYEGADGRLVWANSSAETITDGDGNKYTNIGTDVLEFNGERLILRTQTGEPGNLTQQAFGYSAVSGRPSSDGSFDYSDERQAIPNVGPLPEGRYTIDPSGVQQMGKLDESIGTFTRPIPGIEGGRWPGGSVAWGTQRVWINPQSVSVTNPAGGSVVRDNFSIHGGSVPGSAGCIDLTSRANPFFQRLRSTSSAANGTPIVLRVKY